MEVWGNAYTANIKLLFILQKRAGQFLLNVNSVEHTSGLFIKERLMTLKDLVELETMLGMFRTESRVSRENIRKIVSL